VQVTVGPTVQVHPSPAAAVAVSAVGRVSLTVTIPLVDPAVLAFETARMKVPVWPGTKLPECTFTKDRSGGTVLMLTVSEALSLVGVTSPPPLTVAVLVTEAGALGATFTVRVIAG
jgi:hypothetical protein